MLVTLSSASWRLVELDVRVFRREMVDSVFSGYMY